MMKCKPVIVLMLSLWLPFTVFSQQVISYQGSWGKAGFNLEQQTAQGVQVTFTVQQFTLGDILLDGITLKTIEIPGVFLQNNEGAPNLPGTGRFIAIPQGATASLEIVEVETTVIHDIDIAPAPRIPKETEDGLEYHKDFSIYNKDALYPSSPVLLSEPTQIRGVDVVTLGFSPFQYNPVTKDLIVYKNIRVRVNYSGGNQQVGEDRLRSRWFDPLLEDMLLNPQVLPAVNYNKSMIDTDDEGFEYLIIVPNDPYFSQWADTIKQFRTRQGIRTGVRTLAQLGGSSITAIESYINNAYNTWTIPPVAILLIGDYGTNVNNTILSPIWNSYCVSDNIYGDVNGNSMPDIVMARMTAQNETQLQVMVRKFIDYERNPPTSPEFYNHPITALGWQTERWFQLCSEVIRGFWQNNLGKSPVRINAVYEGNPTVDPWSSATNTTTVVNYFGPSGLNYVPATPQGIGGFSGGTPAQVTNAINNGSFMLQHRDHGFESGWGEPAYTNSDINDLHNTDLCFIMSVNCLTGKYNHTSEVFAEKFHRHTWNGIPSGALGIIAASEISYSFVNDAYIWGVYDNMWPEFMPLYGSTPAARGILPAFGNAAGKYFLQQSSWPYNTTNKAVTYNLFHHHGDAFLSVYSEVPQTLTVVHNPIIYTGVTSFEVTANPGSLICLSLQGEILGTATGTGAPVSISIPGNQIPPDIIDVVVTLQNYYRYEGKVMVIPPVGPYILKESVTINDISGNGNGQADFGENITLTVAMKNVGIVQAANIIVNLQSLDPNVSITDNTEIYGVIGAGSIVSINDAFAVTISEFITDGYVVPFSLTATDGIDIWTSQFSMTLNAPLIQIGSISIADPLGNNNHRLDPGETVTLTIVTKNNGHSDAFNTIGTLVSTDTSVVVTQAVYDLNTITSGNTQTATFTLVVSPYAVPGDNIMFSFTAVSGNYQAIKYFVQSIGVVVEDWESNSFTHFSWMNTSMIPWTISSSGPHEGQYAARSGNIGHNTNTALSISLNVIAEDTISFFRRVSSEVNYDYLQFLLDGDVVDQWSGIVNWGKVSYAVTPGLHVFTWKYIKDQAATGGSDAAWIDYIVLPPFGSMPLQALATATPGTVCLGNTSLLNAITTGGTGPYSYQWSPASTLDNPTAANPQASPLTSTVYSVTVTDINSNTQVATVVVNVNQVPAIPALPTTLLTALCQGSGSSLVSTQTVTGAITYGWNLAPTAAGAANGSGTSAWVNWNAAFNGQATVTVKAINACGQSNPSSGLDITVLPKPATSLAPLTNICVDYPSITLSGGLPAGGIYSGNGVSGNIFSPALAGSGTWPITYTVTDTNGCSGSSVQSIVVDPCSGIEDLSGTAEVQLFPNPSSGWVTIRLNGIPAETLKVRITNSLGTLVREEYFSAGDVRSEQLIDLSGQAEGIYFFIIETSKGSYNRKILLQGK